jgi:hypothetical protein
MKRREALKGLLGLFGLGGVARRARDPRFAEPTAIAPPREPFTRVMVGGRAREVVGIASYRRGADGAWHIEALREWRTSDETA